ncbi:ABC transporter permease [Metabacillus fastidiosus]|uniref:ABC transporter permease n=1 Tax=Metabacillus fastidiosus TaxID=1458 RepID=UPI003D2885FD
MTKLKKFDHTFYPVLMFMVLILLWQVIIVFGDVSKFILPSPTDIVKAFIEDFSLLMVHTKVTLEQSILGFVIAVLFAFFLSILMDRFSFIKKSLYPILVISQTVPIIAITPLLIIWFGFGLITNIFIIILVCFFPITVSLVDGFGKVDRDYINLFKTMEASKWHLFFHVKLPSAMLNFFSGLKIAATYMMMATVIAEWQGGTKGIGVYMVRVKNAYALDKVFASIIVIVIVSIAFIYVIDFIAKKVTHWK